MRSLFLILACIFAMQAQARFSGNKCNTFFNGNYVASKCPGHTLPSDRLRNFDRSSHQIECSANSDSYIRRPQKYSFVEWENTRKRNPEQAFDMRRSLPD